MADLPPSARASTRPLRIDAAAAADADRLLAPATILVGVDGAVAALGSPEAIGPTPEHERIDATDRVAVPGLVNAHTHLDLTSIGPRPFDPAAGFAGWAGAIRRDRPTDPAAIAASVALGIGASLRGGTAILGDIAGNRGLAAFDALRAAGVRGVSFIEVFGIGKAEAAGVAFLDSLPGLHAGSGPTRLGVSPHASYSCGDRLFERAASMGLPVATHLAETLEELEFSRLGTGPLADLLRAVGAWSESLSGWDRSPIARLSATLARSGAAIAHGNYLDDEDLDRLAEASAAAARPLGLVYCPRASAYFGHPADGHPAHRYRELLARGVPVALGTDSLVCLDTADRLSVLDEMRLLRRRDRADPQALLAMATVHGAALLGEPKARVLLGQGSRPEGILGLRLDRDRATSGDAWSRLEAALAGDRAPEWILAPRWSLRP